MIIDLWLLKTCLPLPTPSLTSPRASQFVCTYIIYIEALNQWNNNITNYFTKVYIFHSSHVLMLVFTCSQSHSLISRSKIDNTIILMMCYEFFTTHHQLWRGRALRLLHLDFLLLLWSASALLLRALNLTKTKDF